MRESHKEAGHVSVQEAREMLVRFCNSHFKGPREKHDCARISIPADPLRDDDIRLGAFIEQAAEAFAEVERLRAENAKLRAMLARACKVGCPMGCGRRSSSPRCGRD